MTLSSDLASYLQESPGVLFFPLVSLLWSYLIDKSDGFGETEIIFLILQQIFTKLLPRSLQSAGIRDTEMDQT